MRLSHSPHEQTLLLHGDVSGMDGSGSSLEEGRFGATAASVVPPDSAQLERFWRAESSWSRGAKLARV
jgi:hypothetical protein